MNSVLMEKTGITYSLLERNDLDPVARLVGSVFAAEGPVARYLKVSSEDFARMVRVFGLKFYEEGLSIVARDEGTHRIIGALLNDDMGTETPPEGRAFEGVEEMAPGGALLDELNRRYFHGKTLEPNKHAHFFFLAVSPQYQGRRIAQHLVDLCEELARRKGYKVAVVEATGLVSQHVFRKAGFSVRVEIPYATFEHHGSRPFEGIENQSGAMLMVKELVS